MIVYVEDLLVACKGEITTARGIEASKAKYREVERNTRAKQLYLRMSLDVSEVGMCFNIMPMSIPDVLKDFEMGVGGVTPASGTLFTNISSSPPIHEARRKRFHSKMA